ncbi:MAG TPA: hypothetical protein VKQ06_05450, partial [Gammaproteobacteria bacterium]|nr:hypothetical protein [Gammaproteobacteria bacterium]
AHLAARVQARLAADSAIAMAIAAQTFPENGTRTVSYQLGPDAAYAAEVTIRCLGTAAVPTDGTAENAAGNAGYYEIIAEVHGPRGTRERRKLDWIRYTPPQT